MSINKLIKNILEKMVVVFLSFILYCSVLVEILFPMLLISGVFIFLEKFYWISWYFADPTILEMDIRTSWLNMYLSFPFFSSDLWLNIKIIVFLVGFILFILSLITLVIGIKKKVGLVQLKIYKNMRHPQILSIIIMVFPLFLQGGFRLGNFVSWVQFIFIMIIYSDIGDLKLKKKYPDEFQSYYEKTGFFLPRILPYRISYYFSAIYNKKFRYPLLLSTYILYIVILHLLYLVLPFFPIHF